MGLDSRSISTPCPLWPQRHHLYDGRAGLGLQAGKHSPCLSPPFPSVPLSASVGQNRGTEERSTPLPAPQPSQSSQSEGCQPRRSAGPSMPLEEFGLRPVGIGGFTSHLQLERPLVIRNSPPLKLAKKFKNVYC
uniref:Uncharacterized protein n=1 Tax=Pipistrellus kuhlii TaxID=59472 RepID=A0A7J7W3M8_PIPKU|nr:hypothetical protein mPipKuh1_008158 [Pipistrellus kuhlii]